MFKKVWYNDADPNFLNMNVDYTQFQNTMLKVIVSNNNNPVWFDKFISNIEQENPVDIQIVEDHLNLNLEEDTDIVNEAEDTMSIVRKFIGSMNINTDKKRVETIIQNLYIEAHAIL
jgi:hypothetical protein